MNLEIDRCDFERIVNAFHLIDAKISDREFVLDTIWSMVEGSDLTFNNLEACVSLLDVYDDVEEFAYDRLSGEETNELLEDVGSNTLLKIALDRLVDRGTIMSYNLRNGDATIICDLNGDATIICDL